MSEQEKRLATYEVAFGPVGGVLVVIAGPDPDDDQIELWSPDPAGSVDNLARLDNLVATLMLARDEYAATLHTIHAAEVVS